MEPLKKEWLTAMELCSLLSMNPKQFRRYLRDKVFPKGVRRGKLRVWPADEIPILLWLEKNQERMGHEEPRQEQKTLAK